MKINRMWVVCASRAIGAAVVVIIAIGGNGEAQTRSACQARLTADRAAFKPLGDTLMPSGCGGPDVILLERIVATDGSQITVEPPATVRCEFGEAIVNLVRQDLAPAAAAMGSPLAAIENFDSYDCRGRNRVPGAQLSEHGRANALDVRSVRLKDGRVVRPAFTEAPIAFRAAMKAAVCTRFTTVLGPGSDGYHEDHIHVDLAEHRSGYRMCQWNLHDGSGTQVASHFGLASLRGSIIPLPRPRPFDAATTGHAAPNESPH